MLLLNFAFKDILFIKSHLLLFPLSAFIDNILYIDGL